MLVKKFLNVLETKTEKIYHPNTALETCGSVVALKCKIVCHIKSKTNAIANDEHCQRFL